MPLTRVSLAYLEHRFKLYLRFGEPARTLQLDRWRRCAVFLPGAMLCRIRWQANDYGTIRWQLMVMQACMPMDGAQQDYWHNSQVAAFQLVEAVKDAHRLQRNMYHYLQGPDDAPARSSYLELRLHMLQTLRDMRMLSQLASVYMLFEMEDGKLTTLERTHPNYVGEDLPALLKYKGKTNEMFTDTMLTMALAASAFALGAFVVGFQQRLVSGLRRCEVVLRQIDGVLAFRLVDRQRGDGRLFLLGEFRLPTSGKHGKQDECRAECLR